MTDELPRPLEVDYETYVGRRADTVSVDRLLSILREADGRAQYEAAAGVRTLANRRPDRLRPHVDELRSLLGTLVSAAPLRSESGTQVTGDANALLAAAIGDVVGAHPALLREAVERIETASGRDRMYAISVVSEAARSLHGTGECAEYVAPLESLLDDEPPIRRRAIAALEGIARDEPRAVDHLASRLLRDLDPRSESTVGELFVFTLARNRPDAFESRWSLFRDRIREYNADSSGTVFLLDAVRELVTYAPDEIRPLEKWLEMLQTSDTHSIERVSSHVLEHLRE